VSELARLGGLLACAGLAALYLAPRRDARIAGLVAWALGALLLALYLAPHAHRPLLAAGGLLGLGLAVALAALFLRVPWLVAVAALAVAPFRIPVHVGSTDASLLLPLYGIVVAAAIALGWQLVRGDGRARELGRLAWPLAAFVGWTGLSLVWTEDLRQGAIGLLFFYLPFALLAVVLARLPSERRWLRILAIQLVAMAVVVAGIGVYQYVNRDVFWNPKVIVGNAYAPFFRVNSVFYDPSIYGRFLVCAIVVCVGLVLWRLPLDRSSLLATGAIFLIWVGLVFSFSQSSFAALIAALLVAAALTWRRPAVIAIAVGAVLVVVVGLATPQLRHHVFHGSGVSLNTASSGRFKLVTNGARIAIAHPVVGVGVGSFKHAYAKRLHLAGAEPKSAASHDTPVTVAAETGVVGLALFAWLLVVAFLATLARPSAPSRIVGLVLVAVTVHSLFYNALFEDPITWGAFGLAALLGREEPS
jgi:O-antigen ligase